MAIINCVNTKSNTPSALKHIIHYVTKAEKTNEKLISGKDLMPECAYDEMMLTKKQFNKTGGRQYLHMIQSFSPDEKVDYQTAHEIAIKLANQYKDFQVLIATHRDKGHIHSHLIVNSVNMDNGKKIQQSFKQLNEVMNKSDDLCKEHGLSIIKDRNFGKRIDRNEYHVAMKGESWKMKLVNIIDTAVKNTSTKDEYIIYMNSRGYDVTWQSNRKYITYTTPDGKRCRDNKLHDKKYTKEEMENVYDTRRNERKQPTRASSKGIHTTARYDINTRTMGINDKANGRGNIAEARQTTTSNEGISITNKQNVSQEISRDRNKRAELFSLGRESGNRKHGTNKSSEFRNKYKQQDDFGKDKIHETSNWSDANIVGNSSSTLNIIANILDRPKTQYRQSNKKNSTSKNKRKSYEIER